MPRDSEGWDGKSVRGHVESAENTAALALEVAEEARALVDGFQEDLAELRKMALGRPKVVPND